MDLLAKRADAATVRVLDHLAKLLSGHSECVAVCNISGILYVAANEFHEIFRLSFYNNLSSSKSYHTLF